ncbi:hypothetical protein VTI74DRAFT_5347 [Chaetomium olivicolor]
MPFMGSPIVDKVSAVLHHPNETAVPINANHRTICQFPGQDCQNYAIVRTRNIICVVDALDEYDAPSIAKILRWLSSYIRDRNATEGGGSWFKILATSRCYQFIDDIFKTIPHLRINLEDHAEQMISDIDKPLSLSKINIALSIRPGDKLKSDVDRRKQFDISRRLRGICGPFIRIVNGTVSLIHQTAKDFLTRPQTSQAPLGKASLVQQSWKHCLEESWMNQVLGEVCVTYLSISDVTSPRDCPEDICIDKERGLLDYAAKHWGIHCRSANVTAGSNLFSKASNLCRTSTEIFGIWFQLYWETIADTPRFPERMTDLMVASQFGLCDLVRMLLDNQAVVNAQDSEGWAALHWAVWEGRGARLDTAAVEQLLAAGAAINVQDNKGLTALRWAAVDGQESVAHVLLEAGAPIDIMDRGGLTPLMLAVENGHTGIVELLLDCGADADGAGEDADSLQSKSSAD